MEDLHHSARPLRAGLHVYPDGLPVAVIVRHTLGHVHAVGEGHQRGVAHRHHVFLSPIRHRPADDAGQVVVALAGEGAGPGGQDGVVVSAFPDGDAVADQIVGRLGECDQSAFFGGSVE